jgi:hypothetical protein
VCRDRRGPDLDPIPQPTPRRLRSARAPAGAGIRTPPVRLPAAARSAQAGGTCREPQEDPAALPRGGPVGTQATGAEEGDGDTGAAADGGRAERALVGRFHPRPVRPGAPLPDLQRDRRRDEGMSCRRGRHLDLGSPRRAGTDSAHRSARQARSDRQRPRDRVHLERDAGLERGDGRALALHRAGQADARTGSARPSIQRCGTSS